jgi:tRNA pseudouridine38-40 synthase
MPRYKLTIEYDGTNFVGWQKQPDASSIQSELEAAVLKFCGEPVEVCGAGRTDAGVHATGQIAHIDLPKEMDGFKIAQGINFHMQQGGETTKLISVLSAEEVPADFHARFSATRRHYIYRIINRRSRLALDRNRAWQITEDLDITAMQEGAKYLLGQHDFTSFRDADCQAKSPIKTLDRLEISRHGDVVEIYTHARSFLHHQVRNMVGTLSLVGKGKWSSDQVKAALEAKDRAAAGPTAPPDGLYLTQVEY